MTSFAPQDSAAIPKYTTEQRNAVAVKNTSHSIGAITLIFQKESLKGLKKLHMPGMEVVEFEVMPFMWMYSSLGEDLIKL